ncbi:MULTISPECIES: YsgD/CorL family protein [Citrobacter]|nr:MULTISPECIES: YsgD/CorL family protein [Citrobacter]MCK7564879.1 hypothetical protein [Citrobacter koseri]MDE9581258.1 hypothetical protein [Citrobacter koseri]MDI9803224.1 YsgD/CorL family protein [Citrobacter koseri]MDK6747327.1 YsgD/CorL family protein [Citrobacter sp. UMB8248A]MDK8126899.1 YsgD/CorL family protein [Citrobacter koseri]
MDTPSRCWLIILSFRINS